MTLGAWRASTGVSGKVKVGATSTGVAALQSSVVVGGRDDTHVHGVRWIAQSVGKYIEAYQNAAGVLVRVNVFHMASPFAPGVCSLDTVSHGQHSARGG